MDTTSTPLIKPNHSVAHWLNAFFATMEVVAEQMADKKRMQEQTNSNVGDSYDHEAYKARRVLWKELQRIFTIEFTDLDEVQVSGATQNIKGELVLKGNSVKIFRGNLDIKPLVLYQPLAQLALNLLSFYMAAATQGVNPQAYVQSCLAQRGINKDNWHQHKDKLAITNPWE